MSVRPQSKDKPTSASFQWDDPFLLDEQLTMETKKTCDLEYQKRAIKFMEKSIKADKPFYCYFNHSLMHFPMSPRDAWSAAPASATYAAPPTGRR